ncbi:MAG: hypothetical protein B7Z57_09800, partial [Acidiphilium sp. 37-60-79]
VTDANDYAEHVAATLKAAGLSVISDTRNEKINAKIRDLSLALVPNILVVGRREAEQQTVSLRRLGSDASQSMTLDDMVTALKTEATPPDLR